MGSILGLLEQINLGVENRITGIRTTFNMVSEAWYHLPKEEAMIAVGLILMRGA